MTGILVGYVANRIAYVGSANLTGAGMGNMEGTCGALVGAGITLGMFTKDV